jgi:predicted DNA-binding transcriptional regulator AlpA
MNVRRLPSPARSGAAAGSAVTLDDLRKGPPTVDIPTAAKALGISRSYGFELAKRGEFPAKVIPVGRHLRVVTASLLELLEAA